ncbi:MAG TPA: nucleotidyltransferase domain-containing protein [Thermoanaerobaculia bacterium]|nr:nucleotidyltransferase domain-containing protein [Thermoanaerobaculia bacterium]
MKDRIRRFFEEHAGPEVVAVYLFGSHAEGRAHRESDVDLGVLLDRDRLPSEKERFETRLRLAGQLEGRLGTGRVDVVILDDAPPTLGREIVTRGELLVCRDATREHAFRRDVQLRAADLAPFLRRMRQIKLEALAR